MGRTQIKGPLPLDSGWQDSYSHKRSSPSSSLNGAPHWCILAEGGPLNRVERIRGEDRSEGDWWGIPSGLRFSRVQYPEGLGWDWLSWRDLRSSISHAPWWLVGSLASFRSASGKFRLRFVRSVGVCPVPFSAPSMHEHTMHATLTTVSGTNLELFPRFWTRSDLVGKIRCSGASRLHASERVCESRVHHTLPGCEVAPLSGWGGKHAWDSSLPFSATIRSFGRGGRGRVARIRLTGTHVGEEWLR